jgi:L,D-peptidoglycan transpeptidase YkuD (ErfK/YbiS/YcfS/YnhG family)
MFRPESELSNMARARRETSLRRLLVRRKPGSATRGWLIAGQLSLPVALGRPATGLPVRRIAADDGWCEDPTDRRYNRPIKVPPHSKADRLARVDGLYDFIVIHVARAGFAPTAGCVALNAAALRRLLARVGRKTRIVVD